jgi:multidrug transporter EmrE-like cation transporter
MSRPILFLAGAVTFEVLWAIMLKLAGGFTRPWPSLVCLNVACKELDLSLAYAIWTGSGAALVALVCVVAFGEPLSLERGLGLVLVIAGVVVLLGFEPARDASELVR